MIGLYATESSNIWAGYGGDRYLMLTGVEIGLKAEGSSFYVGNFAIVDSNTALDLDNSSVEGASVVLAGNGSLGYLKGGSSACPASGGSSIVLSSLSPARLNYIRDNESGLEVHGSSSLKLDHVVIDGNLRVNPNSSGLANHLIKMEDASHAVFRNIAVYDNDEFDNPGEPSCINCQHSNSPFMRYNTCGDVSFVASTFGDNETEKLIDMDGLGTGNLHFDHVYVIRTPRKVIANSGYWLVYGSCPSITAVGTVFFDNYRYSDPLFCLTGGFQILDLGPSSPGLAAPSNFPSLIPPVTDIYFVTQHEPVVPYALPTGLFDVGNWSGTATTNDIAPLDVGFHSPKP